MFESKINRGRANGYAPLDSGSKVPLSYLPPIQSTIDTGSLVTTSSLQTFSESIDGRVIDLENWSSSLTDTFATDLEVAIVSSSVAATISVVSSAVGLVTTSSFNQYTASQSTSSLATTGSNQFNGNQIITGSIIATSNIQTVNGYVQTNLLYNGGPIEIRSFYQPLQINSNGARTIVNDNTDISGSLRVSGSIFSNGIGLISGSSQLTSSYDSRYVLSGSITQTTWDNIANKPNAIVSSSSQITALGFISSSDSINSLNQYTASLQNAIEVSGIGTASVTTIRGDLNIEGTTTTVSASNLVIEDNFIYLNDNNQVTNPDLGIAGNYNDGTYAHTGIFSDASDNHTWKVFKGYTLEPSQSIDTNDGSFQLADFKANNIYGGIHATNGVVSGSAQITALGFISSSTPIPAGTISGSSQLSGTTIPNLSGSFTGSFRGNITGTAAYSDLVKTLNSNTNQDYSLIFTTSGSNGYMQTYTDGIPGVLYNPSTNRLKSAYLQGEIEATNGVISGSSQLTASFDTRYTLSGSVQPLPNGLISGSSQLTASYDTRYLLSGSSTSRVFASDNAPSSPTQGDLWWKTNDGNLYVYYDSYWVVATDTISAIPNGLVSGSSQLPTLATTGSNTFTGATIFSSSVTIAAGGGDEGGEILLAKSQTNSTLTGSAVAIDVYQDRLRIFETGGNSRGVYVDLSKTPAGNAGELLWKASGIVNAGTFVTLDNIKATLTSSSNRGLSVAAVSTNFSANISAYHAYSGGIAGISANNQSITTTPTTSLFGWNFPAEADGSYYNILDKTNNRFYRITLMIGASFNNNFISIERLY
jgi:hypothetical protein